MLILFLSLAFATPPAPHITVTPHVAPAPHVTPHVAPAPHAAPASHPSAPVGHPSTPAGHAPPASHSTPPAAHPTTTPVRYRTTWSPWNPWLYPQTQVRVHRNHHLVHTDTDNCTDTPTDTDTAILPDQEAPAGCGGVWGVGSVLLLIFVVLVAVSRPRS